MDFLLVCFFNHWWHLGSPVVLSYLLNLAALVTRVPSRKALWLWQSHLVCSWVFKPFFQRTTSCPRCESQVSGVRELREAVYPDALQDLVMVLYYLMLVYLVIFPSMSRSGPAELCHHGVLLGGGGTAVESQVNVLPITPFSVGFSIEHHRLHDGWFAGPAPEHQMNFPKWHFLNQSYLILKTLKTEINSTMTPSKPAGSPKSPACKELSGSHSRLSLSGLPLPFQLTFVTSMAYFQPLPFGTEPLWKRWVWALFFQVCRLTICPYSF